ncbi:polysaccharide deacetylase family protein [Guptibacillus hwajinpoensis]|uniref:polysaccharide deacetylase family protein n=1 Tax=Guptibacillus hwajinpoensis TaxID=208199 RepID=UPI001CFD33C1|nr:polysaccharide deacetylase family protein [Pseudalkalibacillus hwajinpoensis]
MRKIHLLLFVLLAVIGSLVGFGWNEIGGTELIPSQEESSSTVEASITEDHDDEILNEKELRKKRLSEATENASAKHIPVLTYHHILEEKDLKARHYDEEGNLASTIVLLKDFKKQMRVLHDNGYFTLTLEEFKKYITNKMDIPKNSVLLTFDDGHKNNYIEAYPVLKEYGFYAVEFLITSRNNDQTEPYDSITNQYLSYEEIDAANDVYEFASHTSLFHNHEEDGTAFLISKSLPEIEEDVETSIEQIGGTNALAYPYGAYDEETMEAIRLAGIDLAFTVQAGYVAPGDDMLQIHRNSVRPYHSIEDFKEILQLS